MAASSRTGSSRRNDAENDRGRVSEKITFHYFPNQTVTFTIDLLISLQLFSTAAAANNNATTADADAREGEIITKQVNDEHEENERLLLFFFKLKGGEKGS